jgi:hypothetical protein
MEAVVLSSRFHLILWHGYFLHKWQEVAKSGKEALEVVEFEKSHLL